MKKILSIIMIFVMAFTIANAQTVEHSRFFENTYITIVGGGTTTGQFVDVPSPFFWTGAKDMSNGVRPFAGLELGKYITPVVGVSVEGLAFYNTTNSYTFIDESAVLANGKINFSNWFGGYKGQPRRVEVVGVVGLGWGRDYVGNGQTWTSRLGNGLQPVVGHDPYNSNSINFTDKNYIVYNTGVELNVNLGKARAWQINVRPGVLWFSKHGGEYQSFPTWKHDARVNVQLGVTYKFGSKSKKSHNFVLCPYSVTASDYDDLNAHYEAAVLENKDLKNKVTELEAREPEVKEVVKEVYVEVAPSLSTILTFRIGSSKLSKVERAKLDVLAKVIKSNEFIYLVGSADSATGTEKRNSELAQNRANTVKDILVSEYGISEDRIKVSTAFDTNDVAEASRAVVVTLTNE